MGQARMGIGKIQYFRAAEDAAEALEPTHASPVAEIIDTVRNHVRNGNRAEMPAIPADYANHPVVQMALRTAETVRADLASFERALQMNAPTNATAAS